MKYDRLIASVARCQPLSGTACRAIRVAVVKTGCEVLSPRQKSSTRTCNWISMVFRGSKSRLAIARCDNFSRRRLLARERESSALLPRDGVSPTIGTIGIRIAREITSTLQGGRCFPRTADQLPWFCGKCVLLRKLRGKPGQRLFPRRQTTATRGALLLSTDAVAP
jgi:hypothetical protein